MKWKNLQQKIDEAYGYENVEKEEYDSFNEYFQEEFEENDEALERYKEVTDNLLKIIYQLYNENN